MNKHKPGGDTRSVGSSTIATGIGPSGVVRPGQSATRLPIVCSSPHTRAHWAASASRLAAVWDVFGQ
eukprot:7374580-Pyramimonas_sp.AAC.1